MNPVGFAKKVVKESLCSTRVCSSQVTTTPQTSHTWFFPTHSLIICLHRNVTRRHSHHQMAYRLLFYKRVHHPITPPPIPDKVIAVFIAPIRSLKITVFMNTIHRLLSYHCFMRNTTAIKQSLSEIFRFHSERS